MTAAPWLLVARGVLGAGSSVVLDGGEARHLRTSLRRGSGDRVVLADGAGGVAEGMVSRAKRGTVEVAIQSVSSVPPPGPAQVELAVAVLHGQAMDWAIQKAVELAVGRFIPVLSQRCQLSRQAAVGRLGHWRRVACQALKQCHRPWAMELESPQPLADLVGAGEGRTVVIADPDGIPIAQLALAAEPAPVRLVIGPEGGFSAAENQQLTATAWPRLCLGQHILRAETAALAGATLLTQRLRGAFPRDPIP